jgi:ArsR family transcriptional regulator
MPVSPAQLFGALAHPLRLRAALLLRDQGELCVCELTHVFATQQPVVSRHLAQLRQAGLVTSRRDGTWIHYRLADDLPAWVAQVLAEAATAAPDHRADRRTLQAMNARPEHAC